MPGNRLYSFGAGSSVNRFLLNRIAEIGRGIASIIRHDEPADAVAERFFRQINNPVLTNIQLQWEGDGEPPAIYPSTPPDLFAEQPLVLFGRKREALRALMRYRRAGKLHITGTAAGAGLQQTFGLNFDKTGNPAIAQLWGRAHIKNLMNQMVGGETKRGVEAVTDTALTYQLLSQYTAFVAVSDDVRVNPADSSVSIQVPVEMPEGLSFEGIFGSVAYSPAPIRAIAAPRGEMMRRIANQPATPPQAPTLSAPSPTEARAVFELLQENVYQVKAPQQQATQLSDADLKAEFPALAPPPNIAPSRDIGRISPSIVTPDTDETVQRLQVVHVTGLDPSANANAATLVASLSSPEWHAR